MNRRGSHDSGIALAVAMVLILVVTIMMLGFYYVTTGEQRIAASDRDNGVAFYGAVAGVETMSAHLAALFSTHPTVTPAQITALTQPPYGPPSVPGITYPSGGYSIICPPATSGCPSLTSTSGPIGGNGPLAGLQGIITPFILTVIADGPNNTEVKMTRTVQEVSVPVFEYGIFSDSDLSFFAGPDFSFGGRIHTNGNLFLAEDGGTLTIDDKTTAYKDVIRAQLSNGFSTSGGSYGTTVDVLTTAGGCPGGLPGCRPLDLTEGSVTGGPGSATNPYWTTLSLTTYNGWIRNGATGAKKLNLALALAGGQPSAVIQRPPNASEDPSGPIGSARLFNQASLRMLLSDQPAYIMSLPAVDSTVQPFPLDEALIHAAPYNLPAADACHPPLARSPGYPTDSDYMLPANTTVLGGYIKIEMQLNATPGTWKDVTKEILSLGISRDVLGTCTMNSIVHLEEAKPGVTLNTAAKATTATNFVPINSYDAREGEVRDTSGPTTVSLNGIMNLVEVDVGKLQQWLAGNIGSSGTQALNNSGYILYVSDRRMNCNGAGTESACTGVETAEFGNEDIINPASSNGTPNLALDPPEDVNANGILDTYGANPHPIVAPAGGTWPATINSMPATNPAFVRITSSQGQKNSVVIFRRAVRLVNGTLGNLPPLAAATCTPGASGGFTVASENPVYVLGDYNASVANGFSDTVSLCHVPAAVMADAVTLLSNNWTPGAQLGSNISGDANSFANPTTVSCGSNARCASTSWYRMAVLGGKTISFPQPGWGAKDAGTDGGTHNFLRYIEDWSGATLNYTGSLASFHISRQATGIYKCCNVVYSPPTRAYAFDTDFQSIGTLPPGTPRFTDVNALSYQQAILASQ